MVKSLNKYAEKFQLKITLEWGPVLICASMELIFSIAACIVLSFGSVAKTALITQGHFSYIDSPDHRDLQKPSASHTTPQVSRLRVHKKLKEDTTGTADPK